MFVAIVACVFHPRDACVTIWTLIQVSRLLVHIAVAASRVVVLVSRRTNVSVSSREKLSTSWSREADVSVSAIYVSCPRQFPDGHADGAVRSVNGL